MKNVYLGHGERRRPLGAQDVQTDGPVAVDVGVIDPSRECKFRRFEGVVSGEVDVEEENSTWKMIMGLALIYGEESFSLEDN